MIKKTWFSILAILLVLAMAHEGSVSAYAFGDYYFVLKHHAAKDGAKLYEGQNGFWLRRVYVWYDADISDKLKARARLEMNSDGKFTTPVTNINAFVKDAYICYQFLPLHALTLGIQEHPSFGSIEKFYGYRHLEKLPLNLYKIRDSRDFGLSLKGSFDAGKKWGYNLMLGNYSGYRSETNKGKTVSLRLIANPTANWMVEVYGDTIAVDSAKTDYLGSVFVGYQGDWGRIGANWVYKKLKEAGKSDVEYSLVSLFGIAKFGKKFEALLRCDQTFQPQPNGQDSYMIIEKGYKTTLVIAGLAWNLHPRFQIMPNVKMVSYSKETNDQQGLENDLYLSITFFYQF